MKDYSGYKWIKVKQFKFDNSKSWEENYKELEKHHIEETTFLIDEVRNLSRCSSAEEQLLYTEKAGGSIPSTCTISLPFTCPQHPLYDGKSISPNACVCCWDLHYIMKFLK